MDDNYAAPGIGPHDHPSSSAAPAAFAIRILIPHGASGVVIGRAGAHIKEISTNTDTRLQLADPADPYQTKERIVNISGSKGANVKDVSEVQAGLGWAKHTRQD